MKKNGFTLIEVISVIVIIAILIGIATPIFFNVSNNVKTQEYESKVSYIKSQAEKYAADNSIENPISLSVATLIANGYISADSYYKDGEEDLPFIFDPRDKDVNLACKVINISLEQRNFVANLTDKDNCDLVSEVIIDAKLGIKAYKIVSLDDKFVFGDEVMMETDTDKSGEFKWTNTDVALVIIPEYTSYTDLAVTKGGDTKYIAANKDAEKVLAKVHKGDVIEEDSSNVIIISSEVILRQSINVSLKTDNRIISSTVEVKIDKESSSITPANYIGWTSAKKGSQVFINDGNGSGAKGVYITKNKDDLLLESNFFNVDENGVAYVTHEPIEDGESVDGDSKLNNGVYYLYSLDMVGNTSSRPLELVIENVDDKNPICPTPHGGQNTTWKNSAVTITTGCSDSESGCHPEHNGSTHHFTTTTKTAIIPSYKIQDNVGNEVTCPEQTVNVYVDVTKPTVEVLNKPLTLAAVAYNMLDNITYSDADSGIASASCSPANSTEKGKTGQYTVTCTVTDKAGNSTIVSFVAKHQYTVAPNTITDASICGTHNCNPYTCGCRTCCGRTPGHDCCHWQWEDGCRAYGCDEAQHCVDNDWSCGGEEVCGTCDCSTCYNQCANSCAVYTCTDEARHKDGSKVSRTDSTCYY